VLTIATILLVGFFVGIMPALAAVFENLGVTLPWLTRMFIGVSKVMTDPYLACAALVGVVVTGLALRRAKGLLTRLALSLPVVGHLVRLVSEIRMLTMLALMLQSGLHLSRALAAMPRLAVDPRAKAAWVRVHEGVMEGNPLPREIAEAGLFNRTIRALLTCGDEGGELIKLMQWAADLLDQELDFELQRLVALIEPLTVAGLGVVAGVAVLAAFLPLMQLIQAFMG
jgi:type II secretory pathway component PulF